MRILLLLLMSLVLCPLPLWAHPGTLDAYGCHSNKVLLGTSSKRECHTGLLAGQVFTSTTAEYKAYIAAQKLLITELQAELTKATTELNTTKSLLASVQTELAKFKASYLGAMTITWQANTDRDLAGYRIYCGTASGVYASPTQVGKVTMYRFTEVKAGTWYCAVTAFDTTGNESGFSQEVSKVLP